MSSVRCTLAHRIIHRAGFFPRATCQCQRLRQLTLGLARLGGLLTASQTGALGFFIPCCALSYQGSPRGGEAASVPAGLRARRFAEKQYTRRPVIPWALLGGQLCSKWWKMREIRQSRDLAGLRGSWLERGGDNFKSSLRPQRCVTCHPGAGAQGPNRHGSCTQPLPSRRQGH